MRQWLKIQKETKLVNIKAGMTLEKDWKVVFVGCNGNRAFLKSADESIMCEISGGFNSVAVLFTKNDGTASSEGKTFAGIHSIHRSLKVEREAETLTPLKVGDTFEDGIVYTVQFIGKDNVMIATTESGITHVFHAGGRSGSSIPSIKFGEHNELENQG